MVHTALLQSSPAAAPKPAGLPGVFTPVSTPTPTSRRLPALLSYLQQVPDPRDTRGLRHPPSAILLLSVVAILEARLKMGFGTMIARINRVRMPEKRRLDDCIAP